MDNVSYLTCPECKSGRVWEDYGGGEVVCTNCGAVLSEYATEVMDRSCYEVEYDPDGLKEIRTRLRGTMIVWGMYGPGMLDGTGRRLTEDEFARGTRYHRIERRNLAGSSLIDMIKVVEGTIARLHLPKAVGARAVGIYRKAHAVGIKRPLRRIGAAAIYIACRENNIPVSIKQIVSPRDRRLVWKTHNRIRFGLNLETFHHDAFREVPRRVAAANLPHRVERDAIVVLGKLSEMSREKHRLGRALAAAAVYLCSRRLGVEISEKRIASAADVSEGTVSKFYRLVSAQRARQRDEQCAFEPSKRRDLESSPRTRCDLITNVISTTEGDG